MKLSEFKEKLNLVNELNFQLPNGNPVPPHFHVTEVGRITRHFIDCGGTIRNESVINFQLFEAGDTDHRLAPEKLKKIIALSEKSLLLTDDEIEVEYQDATIGKYRLQYSEGNFRLTPTTTACLASDHCGIPTEKKQKKNLSELMPAQSCCGNENSAQAGECCSKEKEKCC